MSIQKKKNARQAVEAPFLPPPSHTYAEEDENDDEGAQLHIAIASFVKAKKDIAANAAKRVIDELLVSIEEQTKQAEALIVKESKEAQQSSKKDFEKVKEKLESLYNEMREMIGKFDVDLNKRWSDFNAAYETLETVKGRAREAGEKKRAGLKRKIGQMHANIGTLLADAEGKLAKSRSQNSKVPDIVKILQQMV